ncbi:MAG: Uma2 family endonuclease [Polyangiaceae bacterium]|nr:Uma2 family endonuclease [Polyangiaceae bacterium]
MVGVMSGLAQRANRYVIDEDDPRAPPQDVWDAMSPGERKWVIDNLPSEFEASEASPPEGDEHFDAKIGVRERLKKFFGRSGRSVYVGCELPIFYPGERMFAPDIMAVVDVSLHKRDSWIVAAEGRGIDFALEVIWSGRRRKDLVHNVERYAGLGIKEYFVFDLRRMRLTGYRLPDDAKGPSVYIPISTRAGMYPSQVLGMELFLDQDGLRFYHAGLPLPDSEELITRLESALNVVEKRVQAAEERAEEEAKRAEEEAAARVEVERRLAEALAELERIKKAQ